MGVLSKLKGIFYDEVVVEDEEEPELEIKPVKKERIVEEKPKIEEIKFPSFEEEEEKKSEKTENTFSERDLFRSERTFNFTEFTDDEELPPRKNVLDLETKPAKPTYEAPKEPEPTRVFKPTPIISPIYGILDKDYKREEIKEKNSKPAEQLSSTVTSYDTVRRKAYGTLEDELEDTLNSMNKIPTATINKKMKAMEEDFDDLEEKSQKIEELINRIDETTEELNKELSVGELEDKVELKNFEDDEEEKDFNDRTMTGNTLEHDLFNLIDSMYDDKEE